MAKKTFPIIFFTPPRKHGFISRLDVAPPQQCGTAFWGCEKYEKNMMEDYIHNPYISHIPSYSIIFHHIPSYLSNDDLSSGEWRERFGATQKRVSHSQTPVETIISTTPKGVFFMNNQHV